MWLPGHVIQNIGLKFTIEKRPDLWYRLPCYLEQTSLVSSFTRRLSLDFSIACCLFESLAPLFSTTALCFQ
jgi:hypothetical protein